MSDWLRRNITIIMGDKDAVVLPTRTSILRRRLKKKRSQIIEKLRAIHGNTCHWCKDPLTPEDTTIEHLTPLSSGGTNDIANLRLAHKDCNR